jgi:tRNA (guanine37-N1)-methyltransferase
MLKFNIITLFPSLIEPHLKELPFKKAIEKNIIETNIVNLRDFAIDKHGTVDDKPYGGGTGMLLRIEPIFNALVKINAIKESIQDTTNKEINNKRIILLSPKGEKFTQEKAKELSKTEEITFISGRYEGIDARVEDYVTDIISVGDYVLSGGELPLLTIMESITRILPGVLEKEDATSVESFENDLLEYPQYTRPEEHNGKKVPEILLSGNHAEIDKWRKNKSMSASKERGTHLRS